MVLGKVMALRKVMVLGVVILLDMVMAVLMVMMMTALVIVVMVIALGMAMVMVVTVARNAINTEIMFYRQLADHSQTQLAKASFQLHTEALHEFLPNSQM